MLKEMPRGARYRGHRHAAGPQQRGLGQGVVGAAIFDGTQA